MIRRRAILAGVLAPSVARAQFAFGGPITIVVPFAPGGSSDLLARLIAERIGATLGRSVIVENQAGGGGRIAARSVQAAPPTGARLLLANTSVMVLTPLAFADAGYDPLAGFAPVAGAAEFAAGLASGPLTAAPDLAALGAWLRANPGQANAGVPALGSIPHLTALAYGRAIGVPLTMVPYRGGAPIAQELIGGRIPLGVGAAADFAALHQASALRLLAVTGTRRAPGLPDVPTFAEGGLAGFEVNAWNGFFAPAGTPEPTVTALHAAITAALADPGLRARLEQVALTPAPAAPSELREWIIRDREKFGPLLAAAGPLQ